MTKKLFAIVLAAILAISMFTFPAAAAGTVTIDNIADDNTVSFHWGVATGAAKYQIQIKSGSTVLSGSTVTVTSSTNSEANCKSTYKATNGGEITINVTAYDEVGNAIEVYNGTASVPVRQTGTNGVSVTSSGSSTTVSWSAVTGVSNYYVQYTTTDGATSGAFTSGTSFTISQPISKLKSVTVYRANDAGTSYSTSVGSWTPSTTNPSNPGGQYYGIGVSNISNGYAYIYWNPDPSAVSYVVSYTDPTTGRTNTMNVGRNTSATVPLNSNYVTYVSVTAYLANGTTRPIGQQPITPYGTGTNTGYQSLRVDRNSAYTTVSWNSVYSAHHYHIQYTSPYNGTKYDEYIYSTSQTFNFGTTSNSWSVVVYAVSSTGAETYIGGADITPNGVYQTNGNIGNLGGATSSGSNCSVTRRANDAYLTWNRINGNNNGYRVVYTVDGTSQSQQLYANSTAVTIPVGSTFTFTVYVYDAYTNQTVAYGRFVGTGNTVNGGNIMDITKSEIEGVRVTKINSYTTKVAWDRTSDASYYLIQYGTLDGAIADEQTTYNNYYDRIPFGSSRGYFIKVFYWSNANQRFYEVGHAYNVPGSEDDDNNTSSSKNYPSEFKATVGTSKRVTLSWNAADGASYYNIYYKRATSSKWLKIDKNITKTAVNVNGLTNGVDYQFKVVTNKGVESGILKIAPSTTSKTVRAKDPVQSGSSSNDDEDVSLDDNTPSLRSVYSNSKGSITVSWTNVGANSYRIYIAKSNSNSYKYCGTYNGTQATLSSFGSGSKATSFTSGSNYKVRVVRSDYKNYGTITTALQSCAPLTVTVK